jgi:hypothetical protein
MFGSSGDIVGYLGVTVDVTETQEVIEDEE